MAAIRVDMTSAKHVAGTVDIVTDAQGRPMYQTKKLKETDYMAQIDILTRDGARTQITVTPEGDIEIWVVSKRRSTHIATFNQREMCAAVMGTHYERGIATYTDADGNTLVMQPEEYYAQQEAAKAELRERQARNAALNAAEKPAMLPAGQPPTRTYGKRAERA